MLMYVTTTDAIRSSVLDFINGPFLQDLFTLTLASSECKTTDLGTHQSYMFLNARYM